MFWGGEIVIVGRRRLIGIACGALTAGRMRRAAAADEVYESPYNHIIVSRSGSVVALRQMERGGTQSAIDLEMPNFQVLAYTRYLFAAGWVQPTPQQVLGIGLGAGAFNRLFNAAFADAALTTVEVDPMMLKLAVDLTGFRTAPRNAVVIEDGRRFLRSAAGAWDWIILDAFVRNSQTPPHLTTSEFFETVRAHLRPDGAFAMNIVGADPLFYSLVATMRRVFANWLVFNVPETGNRIFLGNAGAKPELKTRVRADPPELPPETLALLARNGVDFAAIARNAAEVRVPPGTPILTDDFAPSEYLGNEWAKP